MADNTQSLVLSYSIMNDLGSHLVQQHEIKWYFCAYLATTELRQKSRRSMSVSKDTDWRIALTGKGDSFDLGITK